ncbi:hypothetical protein [Crenalkalicoccus roseus]|uniref:hypothetical protein n=1 Tax=Crenalkalicoccus roseus TaxID=1485588 RepID=UPI001F009FD3|nr:hypothetical protein [Crenalkalicoccus roseus]
MARSGIPAALAGLALLATTGCAYIDQRDPATRAIGGAALGAGTGAAIGGLATGDPATGAIVGGALGAAGGALTAPRQPLATPYAPPYGYYYR